MKTRLVGILNLTPDSFSDGGAYASPDAMRAQAEAMIAAGASVIDVGAESTRPGAAPVSAAEEWRRLEPFMEEVLPHLRDRAVLSIDTRHAQTAQQALEYGVQWINDVTGFADPYMVRTVADSDAVLVLMHSLGVPANPQNTLSEGTDSVAVLLEFARARMQVLENAGIARERLIFDPGLGFGKTADQSLELVRRMRELRVLGVPLLAGHSRKSFLRLLGEDRDVATFAVSRMLKDAGVEYLRVHDVSGHRELL